MTPAQVYNQIRAQASESSTAFLTATVLYSFIWQAETELAAEIGCATDTDTSILTVVSQREYDIPVDTISIVRIEYDSVKLKKIDLTELDMLEGSAYGGTVQNGQPQYYYEFGGKIGLSPIPTEIKTLKIYRVIQPAEIDGTSTAFSIPAEYGHYLINPCLSKFYAMDDNLQLSQYHLNIWEKNKARARNSWMKKKFIDQYVTVKNEDIFQQTDYGIV